MATGDGVFGQGATFNSDVGFDLAISPDKKAFTAGFGGLTVSLNAVSIPIVMRTFSFTLPLSGFESGTEISFFVQGNISSEQGANGHLVVSINDQTSAFDFPENSDNTSILQEVKYKVGSAAELRITTILIVDRDSKSKAQASLTIDNINTDAAKVRQSQPDKARPFD